MGFHRFAAWDEDGDGSISKSEFRSVARAMGFQISPVEMNAIFEEFDFVVKDGTLSYAEVSQQLMKASPLPEKPLERALAINSRRQHALRRDTDLQNKIELQELQVARATSSPEEPGKPSHPEDMVDQLRVCLTANLARVIDLFRVWDEDSSGTIEKKEFRGALRSIGIKASRTALDLLFDRFDSDRSGTIDYHELNKRLRRRADLDDKLRVGGAGKLDLKASNKLGIRHEASTAPKTLHGTIFDTTSARPVVQQLIDALQKAKARVSTLFYEWDKSGDGFISRDEMASALQDLGVSDGADLRAAVDGLFRSLDWNQSGSIDLHELFAGLKAQRAAAKHALADERNYHSLRTRQRTVVAPHERAVAVWDPQTSCFRACGNTPQPRPTTAEAITRKHAMRRRTFAPRFERQPTLPRAPARPRTAQAVVALSTAASMPAMNHTRSPVGTSDALHSCAAQTSELVAEDKATQACMVEDESQTRRLRALAPAMLHGSQSEPVLSVKGAAAKDAVLTACLPHAAGSQRRYKDAIGNAAARAPLPEASAASTHSRLRHRQVLAMAKPKTPALQFHRAVSAPFVHRPNSLAGLRREAAKDTEWFGTALKCGILPKRVEDT